MHKLYSLFTFFVVLSLFCIQTTEAQTFGKSDKAVFYNLKVSKCLGDACKTPYSVSLDNVNVVRGSFKAINDRITPVYNVNDFLVTVYDRSGKQAWQTAVTNPVTLDIEYDGHGHDHGHAHGETGSSLQRKIVELDEADVAVRLPFEPGECSIRVSYVAGPDRFIDIVTF